MSEQVDYWVRQILGNPGSMGPKGAIKAAKVIDQNLKAGLFPTTGGAVSLMAKEDVDLLYEGRGAGGAFIPRVPDRNGARAASHGEWYVAAVEQAVFHQATGLLARKDSFDLNLVQAMDGFLHTWHGSGVDWTRVYTFAERLDSTVPPYKQTPYWAQHREEPMTVLAFCGQRVRSRAPRGFQG